MEHEMVTGIIQWFVDSPTEGSYRTMTHNAVSCSFPKGDPKML